MTETSAYKTCFLRSISMGHVKPLFQCPHSHIVYLQNSILLNFIPAALRCQKALFQKFPFMKFFINSESLQPIIPHVIIKNDNL